MNIEDAANVLKELGHPNKLKILRKLVKSGYDGLPVGVLREELDIPNSSMSHHIAGLMKVGLITQERDGRILRCIPQYPRLWGVISFLESECCLESGDKNEGK